MMTKVFSTTFFAHKDTRTPLIGGVISIISNLLFIFLLVPYFKHVGVALATSLSAWCNGLYLIFKLNSLGTVRIEKSMLWECAKQLIVSFIMFMAIYAMNIFANDYYYVQEKFVRNIAVLSVIGLSILVFLIAGKIFGIFKFLDDVKALKED
jgi:putative peptidoglycan lipid II flippase